MLINSKPIFLHITDRTLLKKYQQPIIDLFKECFGRELSAIMWDWAYIRNPLGDPLVNLAILEEKVVGHYAFIPIATTKFRVLLSLTTMVSPSARKYNIFFDLANKSYDFAKQMGYEFIIGFPNKNSVLVHEKLLGWKILKTFVAQCSLQNLDNKMPIPPNNKHLCMLDINHADFIDWRTSKPNISYHRQEDIFYKTYQSNIDLLTQRHICSNLHFSNNSKFNFLTSITELQKYKIFEYPFAIKNLGNSEFPIFYPELLMSDVF